MGSLDDLLTVDDFETHARARMDPSCFDYYVGGSGDELTIAANRRAGPAPRQT